MMKGVLGKLSIRPFPCPRLRLGDLFTRHAGGDILAGLAGILVVGRGGKAGGIRTIPTRASPR